MKALHVHSRPIAVALIAVFALATLAPLAEAGTSRRYKGHPRRVVRTVQYVPAPATYVVERRSNAGPLIAGLIGGFILGAAASHAAAHEPYVYWDPYCERTWLSLDECRAHWGHHHGTRVVYRVETRTGRCVDAWHHSHGDWHRWDGEHGNWYDD